MHNYRLFQATSGEGNFQVLSIVAKVFRYTKQLLKRDAYSMILGSKLYTTPYQRELVLRNNTSDCQAQQQ